VRRAAAQASKNYNADEQQMYADARRSDIDHRIGKVHQDRPAEFQPCSAMPA